MSQRESLRRFAPFLPSRPRHFSAGKRRQAAHDGRPRAARCRAALAAFMEAETQKRTPVRPACIDGLGEGAPQPDARADPLARDAHDHRPHGASCRRPAVCSCTLRPSARTRIPATGARTYARVVAAADVELARVPSDRAPDVRTVEACLTVTVDIVAAAPCAGRCIERCGRDMTAGDAEIQQVLLLLLPGAEIRSSRGQLLHCNVRHGCVCMCAKGMADDRDREGGFEREMVVWIASVRDRGNFERSVGGSPGLMRAHSTINVGNSLSRFARQLAANHGSSQRRTSQNWETVHKPPEHTDLRLPSNVHLEANAMSHPPPLERPCAMPPSGIQVSGRSNFIAGVCTSAPARAIAVARRYAADGLCRLRTRSLQRKTSCCNRACPGQ
ncbi:hypothetical protein NUW54_g13809 [Trametes sanguinea]|uniref:Uncharacterized protein n=1 Tax=Trametes sanguinea TaxID=158606 RepID=A0ACC1MJI7_9APHY|nr:hypothetical protein NUW54_g13809 [Trametes sanguinea]